MRNQAMLDNALATAEDTATVLVKELKNALLAASTDPVSIEIELLLSLAKAIHTHLAHMDRPF